MTWTTCYKLRRSPLPWQKTWWPFYVRGKGRDGSHVVLAWLPSLTFWLDENHMNCAVLDLSPANCDKEPEWILKIDWIICSYIFAKWKQFTFGALFSWVWKSQRIRDNRELHSLFVATNTSKHLTTKIILSSFICKGDYPGNGAFFSLCHFMSLFYI